LVLQPFEDVGDGTSIVVAAGRGCVYPALSAQMHPDPDLPGELWHDIRSKVEPFQNDYLMVLGKEAVMQVQNQHAWLFHQFGYRIVPM
jgi:hypothetical protein